MPQDLLCVIFEKEQIKSAEFIDDEVFQRGFGSSREEPDLEKGHQNVDGGDNTRRLQGIQGEPDRIGLKIPHEIDTGKPSSD